jgi:Zn-dependent protease with chaperone function
MQLHILLMIFALLFVADGTWAVDAPEKSWQVIAGSIGPYVPLALLGWLWCLRTLRRLRTHPHRATKVLNRLNLGLAAVRWGVLITFLASLLVVGWRQWLVERVGDFVLVNDLIALAPPVATLVVLWWAQYPIDRRLREQSLLRQIDDGEPIFSFHTRGQFVMEQVRHQLLLVLVPMLLIVTWVQATDRLIDPAVVGDTAFIAITACGGLAVFLLAPLMIRHLWRTMPMAGGSLRDRLMDMCKLHRVGVRELLLWRTHGGLINGAVVGLIAPLRYILLTDGLVDRLDESHVEAVMAHELGHVRRKHMPWLAVCAISTLGVMTVAVDGLLRLGDEAGWTAGMQQLLADGGAGGTAGENAVLGAILFAGMIVWAAGFGYISRRFERQADTFAVQHLTEAEGSETITDTAAHTMAEALRAVSRLNHHPTSRKSWRHGSIDWRVNYLRSLVGRPIKACPIDRTVQIICWTCAVLLIATALIQGI